MTQDLLLGRCIHRSPNVSIFEPLAISYEGVWTHLDGLKAKFPKEGKVLGFGRDRVADVGNFWTFQAVQNPRYDPTYPHEFMISAGAKAQEAIDLRHLSSEQARQEVVERGLVSPATDQVLVAFDSNKAVIVELEKNLRGLFVARFASNTELQVVDLDERVFGGLAIDGRFFSTPSQLTKRPQTSVDWSPDRDFLPIVIKRLKKIAVAGDGPLSELVQPSTRAIGLISTFLTRADLYPAATAELSFVLERMRTISGGIQDNIKNIDEIVTLIERLNPIKTRVAEVFEKERDELQRSLRLELNATIRSEFTAHETDLMQRLHALQVELDATRARRDIAQQDFDSLKGATELLEETFQAYLPVLHDALQGERAGAMQDLRELADRIRAKLKPVGDFELVPSEAPPWSTASVVSCVEYSWKDHAAKLHSTAKANGMAPETFVVLDMAARGGALVVMPPDSATVCFQAYAEVVTGGALFRHALDPSSIGLDDLWRQPGSSLPTAFARAWNAAKLVRSRFHIVVLDGLERSPLDLWLPSFESILNEPRRPKNLIVLGTFGTQALDAKRISSQLQTFITPLAPNVSPKLEPASIARLMGITADCGFLDPTKEPKVSAEALSSFVVDFEPEADHDQPIEKAGRVYKAGLTLMNSQLALTQTKMMCSSGAADPQNSSNPWNAGHIWLKSLLQSLSNEV